MKIYFRTSAVYKNAAIKVRNGEKEIFSRKKAKMTPGEMENITLKAQDFAGAQKLTFELEESE